MKLAIGSPMMFLAMIGIYGVLAYAVAQETHDIGVRMALGAGRGEVLQMVLRNALGLVLPGIALGLAGALVMMRFLSSLLFGARPSDSATFVGVSVVLAGVALLAKPHSGREKFARYAYRRKLRADR